MVVLVLIGIIFSFAMLSLGGDDLGEMMEQETRRLATLLGLVSDEAVLRGEEMAVHFTEDGYEFLVLNDDQWQAPEDDRLLQARSLPADIELRSRWKVTTGTDGICSRFRAGGDEEEDETPDAAGLHSLQRRNDTIFRHPDVAPE